MPLIALIDGQRTRPDKLVRRATCPDCTAPMLAKTGDTVIWHWAHDVTSPNCVSAGESEWHLGWKILGPEGSQERAVGNRRADVLAPGGFAVEFQKSAMTAAEVRAREDDWRRHGLVWVFDATEARGEGRLALSRHPDRPQGDAYRNVKWSWAPERIGAARCRSILDLGEDGLIVVGKWHNTSPLRGYGWLVTREWVVAEVLHGACVPPLPNFKAPVSAEDLAARALRKVSAFVRPRADRSAGPSVPPCSPRTWEPPGSPARCCVDCGRITARSGEDGLPRCHGAQPPEPEAITALRSVFTVDVIESERVAG